MPISHQRLAFLNTNLLMTDYRNWRQRQLNTSGRKSGNLHSNCVEYMRFRDIMPKSKAQKLMVCICHCVPNHDVNIVRGHPSQCPKCCDQCPKSIFTDALAHF